MNFSEEQYRMAQEQMKNMTPDQLKGQTSAFNSMSDEQIKAMSQAQGMNIDPAMFRQASQMMQNMSPEQLEQMRRMSSNMGYDSFKNKQPPQTNSYNQNQNQSTQNSQPKISSSTSSSSYKYPQLENINNLKIKGNEFFKKQDFESAKGKYLEGIFEVEEVRMKAQYKSFSQEMKNEVQNLEIALRMNYANILAKQNEFDLVLDQAKEVLKLDQENGKGNFRMGQALFQQEKFEKSRDYIEKAAQIMKQDQNVQQLYKDMKAKLGIKEEQKQQKQKEKEEVIKETKQSENKKDNKDQSNKQTFDDGVEIQQEQEETKQQFSSNNTSNYTQPPPSYYNTNMPQDKAEQARKAQEQLKNLSPEQLEFMTNQMKNMDKETLRQQLKAQTGMEMSDEQIEMYKNMMTPETLKMMQNMDPNMINQMKGQAGEMSGQGFDPSSMNQADAFKKMQENPDMIKMAMEQMKKNPEMFKSMAKSMGGPMASYLEKTTPEDMEKMMNMMQKFAPVLQFGMKAFGFCKKNKYYLMGMLGLLIVYWFF